MFVDDETNADGKSLGQEGDDHPAHARKGEGPARQKIRGFGFFFVWRGKSVHNQKDGDEESRNAKVMKRGKYARDDDTYYKHDEDDDSGLGKRSGN